MAEEKSSQEELLYELDRACHLRYIEDEAFTSRGLKEKKKQTQAYNQLKALIEGKVSDEFVEEWAKEICSRCFNDPHEECEREAKDIIRQLLEDYHGRLLK